jgi:hypothetical protein
MQHGGSYFCRISYFYLEVIEVINANPRYSVVDFRNVPAITFWLLLDAVLMSNFYAVTVKVTILECDAV